MIFPPDQPQPRRKFFRRVGAVFLIFFAAGALFSAVLPSQAETTERRAPPFIVLCYHDVRDDVRDHYDPDPMSVSTNRLITQFAWLRGRGYHPVTVDQILAARDGKAPLPEKAVLLTFDDGLKSFYTRVFPVLKMFNYPAVAALMGAWTDGHFKTPVPYGEKTLSRADFLSWDEITEIQRSGLVEFASHSYGMHVGLQGNPQGNVQPAPSVRIYDPKTGTYETDEQYNTRIRGDLQKSIEFIIARSGKAPRVMVWPFGKFNRSALEIAASLGMPISFTLDPQENNLTDLSALGRTLIMSNPTLDEFAWVVRHAEENPDPRRVVQLSLDDLYDPDPIKQGQNFDLLVERVKQLDINTVFLEAFSDADGDGKPEALYFPNRQLPLRADLFNRVAWQLKTRGAVRVYGLMPGGFPDLPEEGRVIDVFGDLARYADFDGVVFDGERSSDPDFIRRVEEKMTRFRAPLKMTAVLHIPASAVGEPGFFQRFAGEYRRSLDSCHFTAIYIAAQACSHHDFLDKLIAMAGKTDDAFKKSIFMLQYARSGDRKTKPAQQLLRQMERLQQGKAFQYGYFPDDFINDAPDLYWIRKGLSLRTYPYRKK